MALRCMVLRARLRCMVIRMVPSRCMVIRMVLNRCMVMVRSPRLNEGTTGITMPMKLRGGAPPPTAVPRAGLSIHASGGTRLMYSKVSFIHTDHTDSTCTALGTPSESTQNSVQDPKFWTLGMKASTVGYIITLRLVSFFNLDKSQISNISPRCDIHLFSTAPSESTRKTGLVRCLQNVRYLGPQKIEEITIV